MRRLPEIEQERNAIDTLVGLTGVFEGIASMRISQIKNQVLESTSFFKELWNIYSQLRVGVQFGFGRSQEKLDIIEKELYIVITSEGSFSGDIDQKLIRLMADTYDKDKQDIIVIGHHGALQLAQLGISYKQYFKLPIRDQNINVTPIIAEVQRYRATTVFYQMYESLMNQNANKIELSTAVQGEGADASKGEEAITEQTYIFEPSTFGVVDHLERSMMQIAVSQLILQSKLAQYASRFRAMSAANQRAIETRNNLARQFNSARRAHKDERLKETINSLNKSKRTVVSPL